MSHSVLVVFFFRGMEGIVEDQLTDTLLQSGAGLAFNLVL